MPIEQKAKIGILGASGYTGAELVRLVDPPSARRDRAAHRRSPRRQAVADVFPQFAPYPLPTLTAIEDADWKALGLDLAFCALPHATTQKVIADLLKRAPAHQSRRSFGRLSLGRPGRVCALVWPRARCGGAAEGGGVRADRSISRRRSKPRGSLPIRVATRPAPSLR